MSLPVVSRRWPLLLALSLFGWTAAARAYGPSGFDTVVIDAGHGGYDRGGGPGQRIPEKPYTLDTAQRLQRELSRRGFRTVMTRTRDEFVSLPERVAIANSYRRAIFVSVHYNSAAREGAHGYETYYYGADSFGLASRLHRAQLATLDTEDRHVRRRGFYVVRRTRIPAVLCEGGFLTNSRESRTVTSASYRQRWAENIAAAIQAQRREGNPSYLGYQPRVTSERTVSRGRHRSHGRTHGRSHGSTRRHGRGGSSRHHGRGGSKKTVHHRRRR